MRLSRWIFNCPSFFQTARNHRSQDTLTFYLQRKLKTIYREVRDLLQARTQHQLCHLPGTFLQKAENVEESTHTDEGKKGKNHEQWQNHKAQIFACSFLSSPSGRSALPNWILICLRYGSVPGVLQSVPCTELVRSKYSTSEWNEMWYKWLSRISQWCVAHLLCTSLLSHPLMLTHLTSSNANPSHTHWS